jgi:carbamoyltransferase
LTELFGPSRLPSAEIGSYHKDIARSVQAMYEEALFHLLNSLHRRFPLRSLAMAGGCAMNSVANGKIYRNTPFKELYIQPAAGDAGGAVGAAMAVWRQLQKATPHASSSAVKAPAERFTMEHAFWGPEYSTAEIHRLLDAKHGELQIQSCTVEKFDDQLSLCREAAKAIANGAVVGWFQGRMEWGPRALGNRSIVCDPRRADMKDILNLKIKRRESFRPFAPSILREAVSDWFEVDDDVPFMMQVYPIRHEKRSQIPAVTHVDGSGRLQTVTRSANPLYYDLIREFAATTGVPMVLNTSFNENEPVVCRPEEALDCFLRTKMDLLCMGNVIVRR